MVVLNLLVVNVILLQGLAVQSKSLLPEAVTFAVANSFNNTKAVDLLHVVVETDNNENTVRFLDIIDSLLVGNYWTFRLQIDINNGNARCVSDHEIWFIDSYEAFRRLFSWIGNYHRDSQVFYFIILNCSNEDGNHLNLIQKIFADFLKLMLANVNLLIETASDEVSFYTFYPFQELACRSAQPFKIYQFSKNTAHLDHDRNVSLFPAKANNLNGCPIRVKTRNHILLYSVDFEVFRGETLIATELASRMNFTYAIIKAGDSDHVFLNANSSGPHESFRNGEINMIFGLYSNNVDKNRFLSRSEVYLFSNTIIAFLYRPTPLHGYVWLLIPFDSKSWIFILVCLAVIAASIFLIKSQSLLRSIVQLQHVGVLEILAVTIGSSVEYLPRRSSLRFVFVVLSAGALILRTAYLGELFNSYRGLRIDKAHLDFKDLLAQKYTFYSHKYYASYINELAGNQSKRYVELNSVNNLRHHYETVEKFAIFTVFLHFYTYFPREDQGNWFIKTVFGEQICMYFQQHSIISPKANEIIIRLEESGILHHLMENFDDISKIGYESRTGLQNKSVDEQTLPLAFDQIAFTFYMFIGLNGFACFVFVLELLWSKMTAGLVIPS